LVSCSTVSFVLGIVRFKLILYKVEHWFVISAKRFKSHIEWTYVLSCRIPWSLINNSVLKPISPVPYQDEIDYKLTKLPKVILISRF
jgi:hypothetical protein